MMSTENVGNMDSELTAAGTLRWNRRQADLADCRVGIIGLGGTGGLVTEYLSRLGVGKFNATLLPLHGSKCKLEIGAAVI